MSQRRWVVLGFVVAWGLLVALALADTLHSLRTTEFDGLNNIAQLPLALPWVLLPLPAITGWSYETDAWVVAGMGLLNGAILASMINRRLAVRSKRADDAA
jgi:hypothetical protein